MAESSIPVDLFNPGQVFACLGFLEAADVLCGDADRWVRLERPKRRYGSAYERTTTTTPLR